MSSKTARKEILYAILGIVAMTGIVAVGATLPGLLSIAAPFVKKRYPYKIIHQAIVRLDKQGFIVAEHTKNQWKILLTAKGRKEWRQYELGTKHLKRPKKWDGQWHMLIFDIPESKKWLREKIRMFLRQLQFERLQDSVWVYPFPCHDVLELLCTNYGIRNEALYICATHIDHDRWLRKHFRLPLTT